MQNFLKIEALPWWRLAYLSFTTKKNNKALLERLAQFNLSLKSRADIFSFLGLNEADLKLLNELAFLRDGWHKYEKGGKASNLFRLGTLGLILIKWPSAKISLSDAGRFFLSLAASS